MHDYVNCVNAFFTKSKVQRADSCISTPRDSKTCGQSRADVESISLTIRTQFQYVLIWEEAMLQMLSDFDNVQICMHVFPKCCTARRLCDVACNLVENAKTL